MTLHIIIKAEGKAFEETPASELSSILTGQVVQMLMDGEEGRKLYDSQGNVVGSSYFTRP